MRFNPKVGIAIGFGGVSSSPLSLFAASEPGFWFDPSDLSTLFQDTAGTTPVTAAGQSVARINDKSGRGNHATQSTSLSRPTLGRNPVGGGRNLLTYTEQFDNAAWTMSVNATANQTIAPNGTLTADKWTLASSGQPTSQSNPVSGTAVTFSTYIKKGDTNVFSLLIRNATTSTSICRYTYTYSNTTATLMSGAGSATIIDVGNDWVRASISVSSGISPGEIVQGYIYPCDTSGVAGNYTYLWGAQLETGSTATAYQKVVSSFDVTEAGKADCWYLGFDGSDDFLVTPTITPGTDKAQVFAGVRKLSDAAAGTIIESSANYGLNDGAIIVLAPTTGLSGYRFGSSGSIRLSNADTTGFTSPITNVLTGIGDIAADTAILRVNGTQVASSSSNQGTGNYLAYPAYIGRRAGTSLPFNGRIYSLICRFGSNLTVDQIAQTEAWVNSKTGAY